jgi:hypothetical protein
LLQNDQTLNLRRPFLKKIKTRGSAKLIRKTAGAIFKKIIFEQLKFSLQIKAIKISNENYKFLHCAGLASVLMVYLWPNRN